MPADPKPDMMRTHKALRGVPPPEGSTLRKERSMATLRRSFIDRFMSKVEPEPNTGCWLWTGSQNREGYGGFQDRKRGYQNAHRIAYELFVGAIPAGLKVLHRCDVPMCVNPAHLWLGTDKDNALDRGAKGRSARGERHGMARLTAAQAATIRERARAGENKCALAREFGIGNSTASAIALGVTWKHL